MTGGKKEFQKAIEFAFEETDKGLTEKQEIGFSSRIEGVDENLIIKTLTASEIAE